MLNKLEFFTQFLDGKVIDPEKASYYLLANSVNREAFVYAINSIFGIISIIFFVVMLLIPFTSNIKDEGGNAH